MTWKVYHTKVYFSTRFPNHLLRVPLRDTFQRILQEAESMFLATITVVHVGLSMREMSMMGMTQIRAQAIIIRKNFNKKYYASPNKKSSQIRTAVG